MRFSAAGPVAADAVPAARRRAQTARSATRAATGRGNPETTARQTSAAEASARAVRIVLVPQRDHVPFAVLVDDSLTCFESRRREDTQSNARAVADPDDPTYSLFGRSSSSLISPSLTCGPRNTSLRLKLEALDQLTDDEQEHVTALIEGALLRHHGRQALTSQAS